MLLIKPILEVHPADRTTESGPLGRLPLDSFSIPISPKIYELRARYEAHHATESDLKPPKPKREASQVNPAMLQDLLDTAIKNLGDNPIRIYRGHENHASPLHEVLEKTLKGEKVMDLFKAIFVKIKG
jgi:hypothetical protein